METKSLKRPAAALAATALAAALLVLVKKAPPEALPDETLRDAVAALPPAGPAGGLLPGSAAAGRGMARPGATPGAASAGLSALYAGGKTPSLPEALLAVLGERPLTPPPASLVLAKGGSWRGPAAAPGAAGLGGLRDLEVAAPPPREAAAKGCPAEGHWHGAENAGLYHEGRHWGRWDGGSWLRFDRADGRWWAWTQKGRGPFLWHSGRWWWKGESSWFLLNPRRLSREVFFVSHCLEEAGQAAAGPARLAYSRDGAKAAVLIPGAGAWLFDAETGEKLGRWPLQAAYQEL